MEIQWKHLHHRRFVSANIMQLVHVPELLYRRASTLNFWIHDNVLSGFCCCSCCCCRCFVFFLLLLHKLCKRLLNVNFSTLENWEEEKKNPMKHTRKKDTVMSTPALRVFAATLTTATQRPAYVSRLRGQFTQITTRRKKKKKNGAKFCSCILRSCR